MILQKRIIGLFILPLIMLLGVFIFVPVIGTFVTSLFQDVSFMPKTFVGLDNYLEVLSSPTFKQSLRYTILFTIVSVFIEIILGLVIAILLNYDHPLKWLLRATVLIPWAVPTAISARVWELMYNYNYGLFSFLKINWTGTESGAFFSLLFAEVWKTTPFVTIIILAGLVNIPKQHYEQAMIDGASLLQRFFKITLKLLTPVIVVAALFRTADALRIFDIIYLITNGGPGGATNSLSLHSFKYFVTGDFGKSSTVAIILFFIALAFSIFYTKIGKFEDVINEE
jgi:multiple sugar transport system permease protein